jgi:lysophospholipase
VIISISFIFLTNKKIAASSQSVTNTRDKRGSILGDLFGKDDTADIYKAKAYAPTKITCPSVMPMIRSASTLSPNETSWLQQRRPNTVDPMTDLLKRLNISGFDAENYISSNAKNASALPNIAIAFSGGGYRAMLNGAGALAAFDNRSPNSTNAGHLGGLLQSSTYIAGLSGGSWLLGSIYINNFTTVQDLQAPSNGAWALNNSILQGPDTPGPQILNTATYFGDIVDAVTKKKNEGFEASLTDYWYAIFSD